MSGGETRPIAIMAEYVSQELLSWFKWKRIALPDLNFKCVIKEEHASKKEGEHHHPVDVVFQYHDPYQNKDIFVNTDLKSYAEGSIDAAMIVKALKSLSVTIECARISSEWDERYNISNSKGYLIKGLLFVYNHDNNYDKSFFDVLEKPVSRGRGRQPTPINLANINVAEGQSLHVFEPKLISYLKSIVTDAAVLHKKGSFPETDYEFYYPELRLIKANGEKKDRPATLEMLSGPYLIIKHGVVRKFNEISEELEVRYPEGYIIYYKKSGATAAEFAYLLDILSGYQILDGDEKIRIRMVSAEPAADPISNFNRAKKAYAQDWDFDQYRIDRLNKIEFELVEFYNYSFSKTVISWE